MKVLVTGGTGTISSGIVQECKNCGMETYAITRGNQESRNVDGVTYIKADIWNVGDIAKKVAGETFDVVVECLSYNVDQLKISLENFGNICKQYVFISTSGIYSRENMPIKEEAPKNLDKWEYTKDKIECENYLIEHKDEFEFYYTIVRPVVTYGNYRIPYPVVTRNPSWTFFQRIIDGKPILACDNVKFSVIHIDDFSYAVVNLFGNPLAVNEDFHIADEKGEIYWDDVVYEAAKVLNITPMIIHVPLQVYRKVYAEIYDELMWNKSTSMLMDNGKLRNAVPQFHQTISISKGIDKISKAMKQEFLENGSQVDSYWNLKCDSTIYYAYKNKAISDLELKQLHTYFSQVPFKEKFRLYLNCLKVIFKSLIKSNKLLMRCYKFLKQ